jgi:hypothetical protein
MVSTTSPGWVMPAITAGSWAASGTNLARPAGAASATSLPVTPGSGSSRAAYTSSTIASSASASAVPNSPAKILVRLYRCGWKMAITLFELMSRAARRSAASSVG